MQLPRKLIYGYPEEQGESYTSNHQMMSCDGLVNVPMLADVPIVVQFKRQLEQQTAPGKRGKTSLSQTEATDLFEIPSFTTTSSVLDNLFDIPLATASNELDSLFEVSLTTASSVSDNLSELPLTTASSVSGNIFDVPLATAPSVSDNLYEAPLATTSSELDYLFNVPLATASSELENLFDLPSATASSELDNPFDAPSATASNELDNFFDVPSATASSELDNFFNVPLGAASSVSDNHFVVPFGTTPSVSDNLFEVLLATTSFEQDDLFNVPLATASSELDNLFDLKSGTASSELDNLFDIPLGTASSELNNLFNVPLATASSKLDNRFDVPLATASGELDNLYDLPLTPASSEPIEVDATCARNQSAQQEHCNAARLRRFKASGTRQPILDEKERCKDLRAPKSPTAINPNSEEVRAYFRQEEVLRYLVPDRAFSYTMADGKKTTVAPLRRCGRKPNAKARDHFMLKIDRPPHVTILCLVRDAAARLPGGIGTRADVCTLIRDSQYIVEDVGDAQIYQVVSGALDRLHYKHDPCVRFDGNRKLWVYMHRNREEDDFDEDGTTSKKKLKRQKEDPTDQTVNAAFPCAREHNKVDSDSIPDPLPMGVGNIEEVMYNEDLRPSGMETAEPFLLSQSKLAIRVNE